MLSSFIHYRQRKHIENINKDRYDNEDYSDDERLIRPSSSSEEEQECEDTVMCSGHSRGLSEWSLDQPLHVQKLSFPTKIHYCRSSNLSNIMIELDLNKTANTFHLRSFIGLSFSLY